MAQKFHVVLEDDIDGGTADETVSFSLDGTSYDIDLNAKNAAKLRDALAPYVGAARKAGRGAGRAAARSGTRSTRRGAGASPGRQRTAEIRAWARQKGLKVSERGRVAASIVEQYEAAHRS